MEVNAKVSDVIAIVGDNVGTGACVGRNVVGLTVGAGDGRLEGLKLGAGVGCLLG